MKTEEKKRIRNELLSETILDGWLNMSTAISNDRLVSAMTYNESMVCGALYKQMQLASAPLTATDLCAKLQILKPQMNVILNGLEKRGLICRVRSETDRRQVHITMTELGIPLYEKAHREILELPQGLIDRLGEEKMRIFAEMMYEVADCFHAMISEEDSMRQGNLQCQIENRRESEQK